jgi:hypothetical protein
MQPAHWFRKAFLKNKAEYRKSLIRPLEKQIKAWRKANKKMGWGIQEDEFKRIRRPPEITDIDRNQGFIGAALFYGFGSDGSGHSDPVFSGKVAWEYVTSRWWKDTWQCEYIDFNRSDDIRLRTSAPVRPKGFYYGKIQPGEKYQTFTVSQLRKRFNHETGWGPEGIQFLTITHTHFQDLMNDRKIPFIALADYDVAPHGFNDFYDAVQIFCSNRVLGLGIGNVDEDYPLFGIATIRFG